MTITYSGHFYAYHVYTLRTIVKITKKNISRFAIGLATLLILLFTAKEILFSNWLKNKALAKLSTMINADTLTVKSADLDFGRIYLEDLHLVTAGISVNLKEISAQFTLTDLLYPGSFSRRLDKIRLSDINLTLSKTVHDTTKTDLDSAVKDYQTLLRSLSDFAFINRVEIANLNIDYRADSTRLKLLKGLQGVLFFKDDFSIKADFRGRLLDSKAENISLHSNIDCRYAAADFNLNLSPSALPQALRGDSLYQILSGTYIGSFTMELNRNNSNKINTFGSMAVNNLSGRLLDKVSLTDLEGLVSFNNGTFFLNSLTGSMLGSAFDINGSIEGLVNPKIDVNLSLPAISPLLLKELTKMQDKNQELRDLAIAGSHSLYLHAYGKRNYAYDFRYDGSEVNFQKRYKLSDIVCFGSINDNRVMIEQFTAQTNGSKMQASGEYHWAGRDKNLLAGQIRLNGTLLKEIPALSKLPAAKLQTDLAGKFRFKENNWSAESQLTINDSNRNNLLKGSFQLVNNSCLFDLKNSKGEAALNASYNLANGFYSVEGRELSASLANFVVLPSFLDAEKRLEFEIQGNQRNTHFRLGSSDSLSILYGNLVGTANLTPDSLAALISFVPRQGNRFPLPLKASISMVRQQLKLSSLYLGEYQLRGQAEFNLQDQSFSGLIQADSLNLGKLQTEQKINSSTDLRLRLNGTFDRPNISLWIKEHNLRLNPALPDSAALNGELEAHVENKRLRLEKIFLYHQKQRLLSCSGALESDGQLKLSAYGRFGLHNLLSGYGLNTIKGNIEYRLEAGGSMTAPALTSFTAKVKDAEFLGEKFNNCNLLLQDNHNGQIAIKEFNLSHGDQLDLRLNGTLPYRLTDSLNIQGNFRCNLFKIAGNYVDFLHGSSINEGSLSISGPLKKPRLSGLELYFLDGDMEIPGVFKRLSRFRGKAEMGADLKFRLVQLVAVSDAEDHRMVFKNYHGLPGFDDVEIPGGINFGTLGLGFPDGGITARAPYLMKSKDYGNFTLTGHRGQEFYVGKKNGILALSGKAIVRNLSFTYPFLDEKVFTTWQPIPGDTTENDYPGLYLDLEIIPASGISYYYEGGTNERSVWEKIKASFDLEKNRDINNVWININNQTKGLFITGNPLEFDQPVLSGDIHGRGGKLSLAAFNFDITEATMRFDDIRDKDGYIDPYLSGSGKTRIRSRMDSTGYSGFEELFIKVVSKDNGTISDYEGARFSKYYIEILDDQGNPWLTQIQQNAKTIDAKATSLDLLNRGIDDRVLHPFMIPLERALSDFFGLQFSLNPRIAKNLSNENFYTENNRNYFGNLFEGSEVYITYPKDNFSLTLHSRYVGNDIYAKDLQQEFGYQNNLSLDYYLGNYIYSSAGYSYNTLDKTSGYNLGLTYRYRFQTLVNQFAQLKHWWHKITE